jgi:hypothetical protein
MDVETIADFWTDGVHVVSSMGRRPAGVPLNPRFYREKFACRPDTNYVRAPDVVRAMDVCEVGMEQSH